MGLNLFEISYIECVDEDGIRTTGTAVVVAEDYLKAIKVFKKNYPTYGVTQLHKSGSYSIVLKQEEEEDE